MDMQGLKAHIKSKTVPNILYFTGDEWEVQKIFIKQIAKVSELETKRVESITDIMGKFRSQSFIQKNYIYIARDDKQYMEDEKAQQLLPSIIGQNTYILLLTSVDKRTKFYKTNADNLVEFEKLPEKMLIKYIQKEIPLSESNCKKLIEVCEGDYGRILLEMDKIKQYSNGNSTLIRNVENNAFEILLNDGTIYTPPKDAIFDFVDAVLDANYVKCFDLYEQCKAVGEAVLVMISVLYNNAKAVLQVQSCKSNDVSKSTGLTGFQIMNARKHIGKYSTWQLVRLMKKCIECEQGIKTGKIEEQFAVDYILVNIAE